MNNGTNNWRQVNKENKWRADGASSSSGKYKHNYIGLIVKNGLRTPNSNQCPLFIAHGLKNNK